MSESEDDINSEDDVVDQVLPPAEDTLPIVKTVPAKRRRVAVDAPEHGEGSRRPINMQPIPRPGIMEPTSHRRSVRKKHTPRPADDGFATPIQGRRQGKSKGRR